MSETRSSLYPALLKAMRQMGPVVKNATNPHLKNKYADIGAVIDAIAQPLWENGLLIVQRFEQPDGLALPLLITELIHAETGDRISSSVVVVSKDPNDPQKVGGAITYYRRYSLLALLGLAPEDDDGNSASQPRQQHTGQQRTQGPDAAKPTTARYTGATFVDAPPALAAPDLDANLLARIRDDNATPEMKNRALHNYLLRAETLADLKRRELLVEKSGIPESDRTKALAWHVNRLAPASVAG